MAIKRGSKRGVKESKAEISNFHVINNYESLVETTQDLNEKKQELEHLKKRVFELESEINRKEPEQIQDTNLIQESGKIPEKSEIKKKGIRALVILIIILLIIDIGSLYFYYKPDLSGFFKSSTGNIIDNNDFEKTGKCSDGTVSNTCSKNKPYFCYEGDLIKKAATCGCPSGYKVSFQDCMKV